MDEIGRGNTTHQSIQIHFHFHLFAQQKNSKTKQKSTKVPLMIFPPSGFALGETEKWSEVFRHFFYNWRYSLISLPCWSRHFAQRCKHKAGLYWNRRSWLKWNVGRKARPLDVLIKLWVRSIHQSSEIFDKQRRARWEVTPSCFSIPVNMATEESRGQLRGVTPGQQIGASTWNDIKILSLR